MSPLNHDGKSTPDPEPKGRIVQLGDYQARKAQRVSTLQNKADKAKALSEARFRAAKRHPSQPRKSRSDACRGGRIATASRRSRNSTAIHSDDKDAVEKLNHKLNALERSRIMMLGANKALAAYENNPTLDIVALLGELGYSQSIAQAINEPFAEQSIKNNQSEIYRVRARITELTELHSQAAIDYTGHNVRVYEEDGRIVFALLVDPTKQYTPHSITQGLRVAI